MSQSSKPISPLRQRMIEDMTLRKLNPKTQTQYIRAVVRLTRYLGRSPDQATAEDLRLFQLHLAETGVSNITINTTLTGLKFFFTHTLDQPELLKRVQRVYPPRKIPEVLSVQEVDPSARSLPSRNPRYRQPAHDPACGRRQGPARPQRHAVTWIIEDSQSLVSRGSINLIGYLCAQKSNNA